MAVPTTQTGEFPLGDVALRYSAGERMGVVELPSEKLMIAVLEPRLRSEAVASIKSDLFRKTWLENNLGLVAKDYSSALRVGDRERAFKAISDYRQELRTVEAVSGVPMNSPEVDKKLDEMKEKGEEAFRGDANEQALKQNRAAKSALSDALGAQRQ
jgi:hypothetical protein